MATFSMDSIRLILIWDRSDSTNLSYLVEAGATVSDDTKEGGEERFNIVSELLTISRAQFRNITGTQIENQMKNVAIANLQSLGSGAGTHTISDNTE